MYQKGLALMDYNYFNEKNAALTGTRINSENQ